jgi:hypothetical protein
MRRDSVPPGVQCESTLENLLRADRAGQAEAWWRACEQARAVAMLAGAREEGPGVPGMNFLDRPPRGGRNGGTDPRGPCRGAIVRPECPVRP